MSILTHVRHVLTSLIPSADHDYSTVVYPTRGVGLMIHDGLGIADEHPWRHRLIAQSRPDTFEPEYFKNAEAHPQPQRSLDVCGHHQDESFDLFTVCGIEDAFSTDNSALFKDDPPLSASRFGADCLGINPGSGLPMLDGCIDVAGNPFGSNSSSEFFDHGWSSGCGNYLSSGFDGDCLASGFSSDFLGDLS